MTKLSAVLVWAGITAVLAATAVPGNAQTDLFVGLGPTLPVGTVSDGGPFSGANTGWQGTVGLRRGVGSSGFALGGRLFYGANGYEAPADVSVAVSFGIGS